MAHFQLWWLLWIHFFSIEESPQQPIKAESPTPSAMSEDSTVPNNHISSPTTPTITRVPSQVKFCIRFYLVSVSNVM